MGSVSDREFLIHLAKVHLAECSRRRRVDSWSNFYWVVFGWAQNARRRASQSQPAQGELF